VVADEIRKLAEQASKQGKIIGKSLESLSSSIQGMVKDTNGVQQRFDSIYELSQNIQEQETVIMNAMDEQVHGSQQVLDAMKNIKDTSSSVKDASLEMLSGGQQILKEMEQLALASVKINSRTNEMIHSLEQISEGMKDLEKRAEQVIVSAEKQQESVALFKLK
ncbi:MAG: chemotaxis protein, partial [Treponema sp.]|nr:chemotaxis protein [Treponema sp.]